MVLALTNRELREPMPLMATSSQQMQLRVRLVTKHGALETESFGKTINIGSL